VEDIQQVKDKLPPGKIAVVQPKIVKTDPNHAGGRAIYEDIAVEP
jgi:hypothetical protein